MRKAFGISDISLARLLDRRDQVGILPDRRAILAPIEPKGPARQAFARIPFALAVMQEAAGRKTRAQPADQLVSKTALGRADRSDIPLRRFHIVDRHEGGLA